MPKVGHGSANQASNSFFMYELGCSITALFLCGRQAHAFSVSGTNDPSLLQVVALRWSLEDWDGTFLLAKGSELRRPQISEQHATPQEMHAQFVTEGINKPPMRITMSDSYATAITICARPMAKRQLSSENKF